MENYRSLEQIYPYEKVKREPENIYTNYSSKYSDEIPENINPQKYYYKEELDLKWDERDNDYLGAKRQRKVFENLTQQSIPEQININHSPPIFDSDYSLPREINYNLGNTDFATDPTAENVDPQKYYYKEELNLDWDEKDNINDKNCETVVEKTLGKTNKVGKKNFIRKKTIVETENPDTEKNCPKCNKRLKNLNTMKKHLFYCSKEPHLKCDTCSYKAKYKNALIVHIIKNHPGQIQKSRKIKASQKTRSKNTKENVKCIRFCDKCNISSDQSDLKKCSKCESHLLYKCQTCQGNFQSREELVWHRKKCDPVGYYHCPVCKYKSGLRRDVRLHMRCHLITRTHIDIEDIKWTKVKDINEETFTCSSCNKQYQRYASLASHMRFCIKSQGVKKPSTKYVEKRGADLKLLMSRHCTKCNQEVLANRTYTSDCCESKLLFKCLKCNRCDEIIGKMVYHVRQSSCAFNDIKKCDLCDYEGNERNLALHRGRMHDTNSVECPKCKVIVKNKGTLRSHLYVCGKEQFKCNLCPFTCKINYTLKLHTLKKHPK